MPKQKPKQFFTTETERLGRHLWQPVVVDREELKTYWVSQAFNGEGESKQKNWFSTQVHEEKLPGNASLAGHIIAEVLQDVYLKLNPPKLPKKKPVALT